MTLRDLDFSDSLESSVVPTEGTLEASKLQTYASDAAFVTAKGSAAADGDAYINTTDGFIHYYQTSWKIKVDSASAQTLQNKTLEADTTTIADQGDSTKQLDVDLSGATTSTKTTIASSQTANRTLTLPDATTTLVGTDVTQTLTNKDIDGGTASNTSRHTLPKDTLANLTALTRKEATLVYATDQAKPYYDDGSSLNAIGAGAGSGSGAKNYFENEQFDDTTGVTTYEEASAPYADGTGGSPATISVSVTTTASEVLSGGLSQDTASSLKISKAATDGSAEGVTFTTASLDNIDEGSKLYGSFEIDATHANYTSGDLELHAYDVAGTAELPVKVNGFEDNTIPGMKGIIRFEVDTTTATTGAIRLSLHLESDSTTGSAWDIFIDALMIGPQKQVTVTPYTDPQAYTPVFTGLDTVTNISVQSWRIGKYLYLDGKFTTGATPTATEARMSLGHNGIEGNVTSDSSIPTVELAGYLVLSASSGNQLVALREPSVGYLTFGLQGASNAGLTKVNGSVGFAGSTDYTFFAKVPISGWDSNGVIGSNQKTFRASDINWTRVTTTPAKLGEYRSRTKDAGTTASDAAPTTAPTTADGFRVYSAYRDTAGGSGEINEYEIYVGKNKTIKYEFYSGAGKTGYIDTDYDAINTGSDFIRGIQVKTYDPTTGIAMISAWIDLSAPAGSDAIGWAKTTGAATTTPTNCYFDIIVSESPADLFLEQAKSEVLLHTGNGHGSTGTAIRRFSSSSVTGSALTYVDSSTDGASITVNEPGLYEVSYTDVRSAAGHSHGISVNASSLTTTISSLSIANGKRAMCSATTNSNPNVTRTLRLSVGDVVRPHDEGTCDGTTENNFFSVIKIAP